MLIQYFLATSFQPPISLAYGFAVHGYVGDSCRVFVHVGHRLLNHS
jgi:hypothetical protein